MDNEVLEKFNLLLDDYKIHIQHELLFIKNKLIENKDVDDENKDNLLKKFTLLLKKFNDFKSEFHGIILKQQKIILLESANARVNEKELISLKNTINKLIQVKYTHVIFNACAFTFFLNIFATTMIIQFY